MKLSITRNESRSVMQYDDLKCLRNPRLWMNLFIKIREREEGTKGGLKSLSSSQMLVKNWVTSRARYKLVNMIMIFIINWMIKR